MKIIDVKTQHIVELIKLDFKYIDKYNKDYYSKEKLKEICKRRHINLDQFLKYYNKNPKHYKFNKIAIAKSKKGLWIGEDIIEETIIKMYEKCGEIIKKFYFDTKLTMNIIIAKGKYIM